MKMQEKKKARTKMHETLPPIPGETLSDFLGLCMSFAWEHKHPKANIVRGTDEHGKRFVTIIER